MGIAGKPAEPKIITPALHSLENRALGAGGKLLDRYFRSLAINF
jgi:hypothetical protein